MRISDWSSDVCSSDLVAAYEVGVFVGLEVAEANDGGVRVIGTCELGDTASEDIDEIVGRMRVSACEFPDLALGFRARPLGVDERPGMDLDVGVDDEFHTGEAAALCGQPPQLEGRGRVCALANYVGPGGRQGTELTRGHRENEDTAMSPD